MDGASTAELYLGLDLGATNVKGALVALDDGGGSDIVVSDVAPTRGRDGPEAVVERMVDLGRGLLGESAANGLGMAVPGLFDGATGVIETLPNLPGWEQFQLVERLAPSFDLHVTLVNDARAFALAEARLGAGRGARSVVGITLGTGIGGGIVVDGRLQVGAFGTAGEIGHQTIEVGGPTCGCGNRGCLEALARPPVVAASIGAADFEEVMARFEAGDEEAGDAVETMASHLGVGIANLLTVLGPDRVVIGGGAAQAGSDFLNLVRRAAIERAPLVPSDEISIVAGQLGVLAGAVGAAVAARDSER